MADNMSKAERILGPMESLVAIYEDLNTLDTLDPELANEFTVRVAYFRRHAREMDAAYDVVVALRNIVEHAEAHRGDGIGVTTSLLAGGNRALERAGHK